MNTTYQSLPMVQLSLLFVAHNDEHKETIQHTLRCTELIGEFGSFLKLDESDITLLKKGAMLHDIGKFFVPAKTLYANRRLKESEFELIKTHPLLGEVDGLDPVVQAIKEQHHEALDGSGYPLGLTGSEIHPFAQIMAIVDVYDALKTPRAYKTSWSEERIYQEMMSHRGTRFNAIYLDAFFSFIELNRT